MKKKRRVFWAVEQVQKLHKERALLLNEKGYDIQFFTSVQQFVEELSHKRAAIILVSDTDSSDFAVNVINALMGLPQIQGARMVLTSEKHSKRVKFYAAVASFRDIIPMDLNDKQFLQRFIFSTANRSLPFIQPAGQVTLSNISAVSMPARITWISGNRLRIECRVKPPIGAMLNLRGELARSMGVNSISLTVVENQRTHLIYRFSEAMICEWSVPQTSRDKADQVYQQLQAGSPHLRCRVFVCAQSNQIRNTLMDEFDDPRFEVSAALQKHSLINEPKFFTPHVIVVEDTLVNANGGQSFREMLNNSKDSASVFIVGDNVNIEDLRAANPNRRIKKISRIPPNFSRAILDKYAPIKEEHNADDDAIFVTPDNSKSMAEIAFSARLTRIHPVAVQVSLPFPVGQFALCRIESPILHKALGRSPYMKFTATYPDSTPEIGPYSQLADGYLADLNMDDRKKIGQTLSNIIYEQMVRFDVFDHRLPSKPGDAKRTPELGSVKQVSVTRMSELASRNPRAAKPAPRDAAAIQASANVATATAGPQESRPVPSQPDVVGNTAIKREAVSLDEIVDIKADPTVKPGKLVHTDFADLLRPGVGPMSDTVDEIKQSIKETAGSDGFLLTAKYVAIVTFLSLMFWGAFTVMSHNYERSGKSYSDSIRKFAPNHFKRFQNNDD